MTKRYFAAAAAAAILFAVPALAHPKVSAANPGVDAVAASPAKIVLEMSEKLEPKFSGVELMKADGSKVPVVSKVGGKDGKTIEAQVKGKLAPGAYMVLWRAVGADGHPVKGNYNFTVR